MSNGPVIKLNLKYTKRTLSLQARYSSSFLGYNAENCSWSFLFSLPQLVMISNLQNLLGGGSGSGSGGGGGKPTIQPNDYMDNLIDCVKANMKERYSGISFFT